MGAPRNQQRRRCRIALKFTGRTPSRGVPGLGWSAASPVRAVATRIAVAAAVLCVLVALARARFGDTAPWPTDRPLHIMRTGFSGPTFQPRAQLQEVPAGAVETAGALVVFVGQVAQELLTGRGGAVLLVLLILTAFGIWWGLAHLGEWRRPSVPLGVLITLQLTGASYYLTSFVTPSRRLQTLVTAFDFHTHTTHSNGLLTPQQQIDWHRARGFAGLAFTDSNVMLPADELAALRSANPDMVLLNGCEYHGDAHLILLGLRHAISARDTPVPAAIKAARQQGAIVIVAHPWSPGRYSPVQLLQMGVDGFEAWNGVVWSHELALLDRSRNLIATTATDTLSKSGARCFTWTLLPRGINSPDKVLRALHLRKTAAAFALNDADTPAAYDARQTRLKGPAGLALAVGEAWRQLTASQRICTLLGLVVVASLLCAWGAQSGQRGAAPLGPSRALGFLRRRRLITRLIGCTLVVLAFVGSADAALLTMGSLFKSAAPAKLGWSAGLTPLHAMLAWLLLDGLYLYGRALWRRTQ